MNLIDMRTVIFNYLISSALCTGVVTLLWLQNRRRFAGPGLWLVSFAMQTVYMLLVVLRGIAPDWISMIASNVLLIGGTILLYNGLERFVGQRGTQIHNIGLLAIFTVVQAYFVFVQPNLAAREINISVGLLVICIHCAWLMLHRVGADIRPMTKGIGLVFVAYCLVSVARIIVDVVMPPGNDFFKESGPFDILLILAYQMLFIVLTFSLFLMINYRLLTEQTADIAKQQQIETALRHSEEKFSKAFHASPDAIVLSRLKDGRIIEVNEGFSRLSGYSQEEALANPSIVLELWANPQDRERCISALRENHSVRDYEYDFRTKSGGMLRCLYSGEIIDLGGEAHMLSVVRDITERKQAEAEIARLASFPQLNASPVLEIDAGGAVTYYNPATLDALEKQGSPADPRAFVPPDISEILQTLARGEATSFEREIALNGRVWSETIHLVPEFQSVRINTTDITARKQVEEALLVSETRYRRLFEAARDGILILDVNTGQITDVNPFLVDMLGYSNEELLGKKLWEIGWFKDTLASRINFAELQQQGYIRYEDLPLETSDGRHIDVEFVSNVYLVDHKKVIQCNIRDITARKQAEDIIRLRLQLLEFAADYSLEELMQRALDEIGEITGSPIGFYHFVEADQKTLLLQTWSTRTEREFCRAEGKGMHYSLDQAGVWVDCVYQRQPVIHNDYAALPHRKGMPPGHAEVKRELVVPTIREGRIVSILGVGNKPSDYDEHDVELVAYVADVIWSIVERKQTEEKLRASEARYDELVRRIPVGVYIFHARTDGSMYFEYTSPQFNHLLDLEAEAVQRDANLAFAAAHPQDRADLIRADRQATITLTPFRWEGRYIIRGETRWIRIESEPTLLPGGDSVWNGVISDITERKQVEDELRSLNDRFALYLKYIPIPMYVKDADTRAIVLSRQFEQMLGKPLRELLDKTNAELWPPELAGPMTLDDERILKGDQAVMVEETFGGRHYYSVKFPIKEPDRPPLLGGYTMDITELKQTQAALQESEARMRQITVAMRQAVWLRDVQANQMLYVNPAYEEIWGRTCESLIADPTSFLQAIHPEDKERILEAIEKQYQGVFFNEEYRILRPDGTIRWVWGGTFPIKNKAGQVHRILAVVEDITERRRMADALRQAKEAAEAANRAKSTFLANMSHELRTPLSAILGFSELMTQDPNLTTNQRENLAIIGRSGEHLLALINNVLDLSKIEAGRMELQLEVFDLHEMLLGLGEMFSLRAEQKGLTIIFDLAPDVPRIIRTDAGKLRQILINLLGNALKFTSKGGITMRVEPRTVSIGPQESKTHSASDIWLHFTIKDTGIGIDPDELDKVFETFVQTESGRQSRQGTGLGLPISREYVQLMGGDLTVQSEVGQGSCFQFDIHVELPTQADIDTLVAATASRRAIGIEPTHPAPEGGNYRILVVDDVEASRKLLFQLLHPLGFEVRTASDGGEGLEVWEAWRPHLIFMDIGMPGTDGREVTKHIRAHIENERQTAPAQQCLPIIVALTASAFDEDRETILAEGCDDFVMKPFREAAIFEVLSRHLGIRFVYADETAIAALPEKEVSIETLKVQAQNLPAEWRIDIQQAALVGDVERLNTLVAQVRDQFPALARHLAQYVYNFEYNKIRQLIQPEKD